MKKPDPATDTMTRAQRKAARKVAWKRESAVQGRKDAQVDRWAEWEKATGQVKP